jgi:hypothetical protein
LKSQRHKGPEHGYRRAEEIKRIGIVVESGVNSYATIVGDFSYWKISAFALLKDSMV